MAKREKPKPNHLKILKSENKRRQTDRTHKESTLLRKKPPKPNRKTEVRKESKPNGIVVKKKITLKPSSGAKNPRNQFRGENRKGKGVSPPKTPTATQQTTRKRRRSRRPTQRLTIMTRRPLLPQQKERHKGNGKPSFSQGQKTGQWRNRLTGE